VSPVLPGGFHLVDTDSDLDLAPLPDDLDHWLEDLADERDEDDLSQDPLVNDRPAFDQDAYYDGLIEL
jgi:hypothetical protein